MKMRKQNVALVSSPTPCLCTAAFSRPLTTREWCKGSKCLAGNAASTSLRREPGIRTCSAVSNPSTRMKVADGGISIDGFARERQTDRWGLCSYVNWYYVCIWVHIKSRRGAVCLTWIQRKIYPEQMTEINMIIPKQIRTRRPVC